MHDAALIPLVVLALGFAVACRTVTDTDKSKGAEGDYCATLKDRAALVKSFTDADEPDFSTFDDFVAVAERLESQAPADLTDDWASLVDSLHGFQAGLKDQGLTASEYGRLVDNFDNLSDSESDKVTAVISKMAALSSDKVGAAIRAVVKQAKTTCSVDLTTGK